MHVINVIKPPLLLLLLLLGLKHIYLLDEILCEPRLIRFSLILAAKKRPLQEAFLLLGSRSRRERAPATYFLLTAEHFSSARRPCRRPFFLFSGSYSRLFGKYFNNQRPASI